MRRAQSDAQHRSTHPTMEPVKLVPAPAAPRPALVAPGTARGRTRPAASELPPATARRALCRLQARRPGGRDLYGYAGRDKSLSSGQTRGGGALVSPLWREPSVLPSRVTIVKTSALKNEEQP